MIKVNTEEEFLQKNIGSIEGFVITGGKMNNSVQ
jgi:hypothetical protein